MSVTACNFLRSCYIHVIVYAQYHADFHMNRLYTFMHIIMHVKGGGYYEAAYYSDS